MENEKAPERERVIKVYLDLDVTAAIEKLNVVKEALEEVNKADHIKLTENDIFLKRFLEA